MENTPYTSKDIREYSEYHQCSLKDAEKILKRNSFCKELRTDKTISDLADTIIRILDHEFGDYNS